MGTRSFLFALAFLASLVARAAAQETTESQRPGGPARARAAGKTAFVSSRDGNPEIYTINTDGTDLTRLTNDPANDEEPAWSPDGQRIAFVSERSGRSELYVIFLGVTALPPGGSITITITIGIGAAIFYGARVDNTTGDPSLQTARAAP